MNELEKLRRKLAKQGMIFDGSNYIHTTDESIIEQYLNSDNLYKPKKRTRQDNPFF